MINNILFITPVFEQGGTEVYVLNISKYLKERGYNVEVVSSGGIREFDLDNNLINHTIISELRTKNIFSFIKSIIKIRKLIKEKSINIIHSSSIYTLVIAKFCTLLLDNRVKTVYTMHGGPNRDVEKTNKIILNKFVDRIIALSEVSKKIMISNGVKKEKIHVIYNGIEDKYIKKKLKYNDKFIITTCGRLTEQKGQKFLIDAIKEINIDNFELRIIGDGELKKELNNRIIELGLEDKIKILGFKDNVLEYLEESDIFILPSLWEQFPIAILEAMMMQLPIIATSVNGVPEEVGEAGILISPRSSDEIRSSLEMLYYNCNERKRLAKFARERFEKNFTLNSMGRKTEEVYKKLIKKG